MWIWLAIGSAVLLGFYDIAKKQALSRNHVLNVLLYATAFSALLTSPFLKEGQAGWHFALILKAVLVTASWISGLSALKYLPITTASTIKASRPVFVLLFSLILFGERLNLLQWGGCALAIVSLYMMSCSSRSEGIEWSHNKGILLMAVSVLTGVASALYDKHILNFLEPLFTQSWSNVYITALLALTVIARSLTDKKGDYRFHWDWTVPLIALLITGADFMYFTSLHQSDALLSVISMIRRSCVIVTFVGGAILFKEKNIRGKTLDLLVMLAGMVLIVMGSV